MRSATFPIFALCLLVCNACSEAGVTGGGKSSKAASSADGEPDPADDEQEEDDSADDEKDDGSDVPVWVNAAALTCSWEGAESEKDAKVLCGLVDAGGQPLKPDPKAKVVWSVTDLSKKPVDVTQRDSANADRIERQFVIPGDQLAERSVVATVGDTKTRIKRAKISDAMRLGKTTLACLQTESVPVCYDAYTTLPEDEKQVATLSQLRLFVSSTSYTSLGLGSASNADAICRNLAVAAGLGAGSWVSVIAGASFPAKVPVAVPIVLVDGTKVFDAVAQMGGAPSSKIELDETSATVAGIAWTGFAPGTVSGGLETCTNWTSPSGVGRVGAIGRLDSNWLTLTVSTCSAPAHLYCLEIAR